MMMKSWIKKSFVLGMSLSFLMPNLANALDATAVNGLLNMQSSLPLIKPGWANFILHKESLLKLYTLRGNQPIWVDANGAPNAMFDKLKQMLQSAERQGLNSSEYWTTDVEQALTNAKRNSRNAITLELVASEALIRYVMHLSSGRVDPEQIDTDIKFKRKEFTDYSQLNVAVSYGPESFVPSIDAFAPTHPRYYELLDIRRKLTAMKNSGSWEVLKSPGFALKLGVKDDPVIGKLRARFAQLGYSISQSGNKFDSEFDSVLRQFQQDSGMAIDGVIGTNSEVIEALNISIDGRIDRVDATLEKIRWLPKNIESRHIFVNLAATEFYLFDAGQTIFHFKTINGQAYRRTPSMKDSITFVNLNPYWTVPRSIAIKDKLRSLKEDSRYLEKNNMLLIDEGSDEVVDPASIDWDGMTARNFTYYIRQLPGPTNALGVVKFPLQNPWAIYLHDTNDHELFKQNKRHLSSGCVRLEDPIRFAAYLLQDQQGWSEEEIRAYTPAPKSTYIPGEVDKKIFLKKPMPVYFLYLTVEKGQNGLPRFIKDVYGQDERVIKAIKSNSNSGEVF